MSDRFQIAARILLAMGVSILITPAARASEDAVGCTSELALPTYQGFVASAIPAVIRVEILIGNAGRAKSVTYNTSIAGFRSELDDYFAKKTTYSAACEGRTITFFVSYKFQEDPTAITEVHFGPPDQIVIVCRQPTVALDPIRPPYQLKKKGN